MLQMIAITILLFVSTAAIQNDNETHSTTPISTPLLREELFTARFYHEVWTTIHFADITEVKEDCQQMDGYIQKLRKFCLDHPDCTETVNIRLTEQRISKLQAEIDSLLRLSYAGNRRKRGLLNFVGSVSKFLFGTMSASDAEEINRQIDAVYNNTAGVAHMMKNQTVIIRNTIRKLTEVAKAQDEDITKLQAMFARVGPAAVANEINLKLIDGCAQANAHLDNLRETTNLLLDAVNAGKTGIVSPVLVTPENFLNGLSKIKDNLYFKELPFPLHLESYVIYMKISKVNIMLTRGKIV